MTLAILISLIQTLINSAIVIASARQEDRFANLTEIYATMPSVILGFIASLSTLSLAKFLTERFPAKRVLVYWFGAVAFGSGLAFARVLAINDLTPEYWKDPVSWWRMFTASILFYITIHVSLGVANAKLTEQVKIAQAANEALELQRGRLISAGEDVRRQIADFLHDRLQSDLVLLGMQMQRSIEKLNPEDKSVALAYIDEIERIRQFDVRSVSRQLAPELDGPSLRPPLEELLGRYEKAFKCNLDLRETGNLAKQIKLACYRIVEQALLNAAKHASAKQVWVRVQEREHEVEISIENDGAPLPEKLTPGAGFAIFDDWSKQHGGSWNITNDSTGTRLVARLLF